MEKHFVVVTGVGRGRVEEWMLCWRLVGTVVYLFQRNLRYVYRAVDDEFSSSTGILGDIKYERFFDKCVILWIY